jgi:hypothetical protein
MAKAQQRTAEPLIIIIIIIIIIVTISRWRVFFGFTSRERVAATLG